MVKMSSITRWLDVEVGTSEIDLNTLPSNLALIDLYNDNEIKLLVGDLGRGLEGPKIKVSNYYSLFCILYITGFNLPVHGLKFSFTVT